MDVWACICRRSPFIDVGAAGLTLRDTAGAITTEFSGTGAVFHTDVEVQGTATCPTVHTTLLRALDNQGVVLTNSTGTICMQTQESGDCKIPQDLSVGNVAASSVNVSGIATCPTVHTTLLRALDNQGVVITNATGTICMQTQETGDCLIPQDLSVSNVVASSVSINGSDVVALLDQREPAFTVTAPLLKTTTAGGYSLGINPSSAVTAAAFAVGGFRILEDTADLLKFQILDTGGTNRWQNAAVMA